MTEDQKKLSDELFRIEREEVLKSLINEYVEYLSGGMWRLITEMIEKYFFYDPKNAFYEYETLTIEHFRTAVRDEIKPLLKKHFNRMSTEFYKYLEDRIND